MIQFGSDKIKEIYYGSDKIKEVYHGGDLVWWQENLIPVIDMSCPSITGLSTGEFQMAHSICTDGTYIYVGERIDSSTPNEISRIVKFNQNLGVVGYCNVGADRDVETLLYDNTNNRLYAGLIKDVEGRNLVSILRVNPATMSIVDETHFPSLISSNSYALETDEEYLYGATSRFTDVTIFKIKLSDMSLVATKIWTGVERAHAARIDLQNGFLYLTHIAWSTEDDVYFAKVSLADLSYSQVNLGAYVRKATDDFAMIQTADGVYCYVGSEYVYGSGGNAGYGGVEIKTSDLSIKGISLSPTYCLKEYGDYVYNVKIGGGIEIVNRHNLKNVLECSFSGHAGTELSFIGKNGYCTKFDNYDKNEGKLIKFEVTHEKHTEI